MRDEVIVIGEHGPSLKLPVVIARHRQQTAMQHPQTISATKVMRLEIGAGGDEVGAARRKLMCGCVWPGWVKLWHGSKRAEIVRGRPAQCESGRGLPQSKTQAFAGTGWNARELLECANLLALWKRASKEMAGKS